MTALLARDLHAGDVYREHDWSLHVRQAEVDEHGVAVVVEEFPGRVLHLQLDRILDVERTVPVSSTFEWRGVDARCVGRTGRESITDLCAWVEAKYTAGWRKLTVHQAGSAEVAGEIAPDWDTGRRTWWAER